jgi:hypothetical protein
VKSTTTERFRAALEQLPERVQRSARRAYRTFQKNPQHPSLQFKQVHPTRRPFSEIALLIRLEVDLTLSPARQCFRA